MILISISSQVSSLEQLGSSEGDNGSQNTDVSHIIVNYLHQELEELKTGTSNEGSVDHVLPVLHVLTEASRHHKTLRRSIRQQVMPARKDFR